MFDTREHAECALDRPNASAAMYSWNGKFRLLQATRDRPTSEAHFIGRTSSLWASDGGDGL